MSPLADLFDDVGEFMANKSKSLVLSPNPILDGTSLRNFMFTERVPSPTLNKIYRVSEVLKLCPREEVIRYLKKIPTVQQHDIQTLYYFAIGNAFHKMFREQILGPMKLLKGHWECRTCRHTSKIEFMPAKCSACKVEGLGNFKFVEERVEKDSVCGHPDGRLVVDGYEFLLELKTIGEKGFARLTKSQPEHERQVQMYLDMSGLEQAVVVYLRREAILAEGVLQMKTYIIKKNNFMVMPLYQAVKDAKAAMRAKKIPELRCTTQRSCKFGECRTIDF